jgi:hypothetical protein
MHPARYLATRATFAPPTDTGGSGIAPDGGDQAEETLTTDVTALLAQVSDLLNAIPPAIKAAVAAALANTPTGVADSAAEAADTAVKAQIASVQAEIASLNPSPPPPPPPPPPAGLTFSPDSVSAVAGVASQTAVAITGGIAPFSLVSPPGGVTYDGTNVDFDTTTVAGTGDLEFEDSTSGTPLTGTLTYTIAPGSSGA